MADRIQSFWVISLPKMPPESVGVSTASQRDAALAGNGLPRMMLPGTPGAHIMIPINPPAKASTLTDQASDHITQAPRPLPEDLRARPPDTEHAPIPGDRAVLRDEPNYEVSEPRRPD